jgi:hypothetical protein
MMKRLLPIASAVLLAVCAAAPAMAKVVFSFDYSMDPGGLFDSTAARAAMDRAGQVFSDRLLDNLSAISPASSDTWSPQIVNPGTGLTVSAPLTSEAANVIKVYVGSRALTGTDVGNTVIGFGSATGSQTFTDSVQSRGQPGALATAKTDFAPWGGSISFDIATQWFFGLTTAGISAQKMDFLSVATHELEHLLGFSTSQPSFANLVTAGKFTGAKAVAANGGVAPTVNGSHWFGMNSTVGLTGPTQVALMNSGMPFGSRRSMTQLDWAGLDDLGWSLAMPGDANADGVVNFVDFQAVETNFGETNSRWSHGDFNEDGTVDRADFALLVQNYGKRSDGSFAAPSAAEDLAMFQFAGGSDVPEPGVMGLLCMMSMAGLGRRRFRLR